MMRKKSVQSMDSRLETMVENAFYAVNPPDSVALPMREETPLVSAVSLKVYPRSAMLKRREYQRGKLNAANRLTETCFQAK